MLIKISVLNLPHYWHLVLGSLEIKFYLLKKNFLFTYILTFFKPLPLTEVAELPEFPEKTSITSSYSSARDICKIRTMKHILLYGRPMYNCNLFTGTVLIVCCFFFQIHVYCTYSEPSIQNCSWNISGHNIFIAQTSLQHCKLWLFVQ